MATFIAFKTKYQKNMTPKGIRNTSVLARAQKRNSDRWPAKRTHGTPVLARQKRQGSKKTEERCK
jgi:hypothetical protein